MRTDYVMYLDFAEAFPQLTDNGLIEEVGKNEQGDPLYAVTRRGCLVAEELKSDLFQSVLDKSLACALQYLDFRKHGRWLHHHQQQEIRRRRWRRRSPQAGPETDSRSRSEASG